MPDDLSYHIDFNVWVRELDDGLVEIGFTDIAQTMAGSVIHCMPKKLGKVVKKGKSLATVESGKWVGPVKSPFTGEIVAVNEAAKADATILNRSPYKEGWIVRIKPDNFEEDKAGLASGDDAIAQFSEYMSEKELEECIHCEGFEG